jgi:hypothetical protein
MVAGPWSNSVKLGTYRYSHEHHNQFLQDSTTFSLFFDKRARILLTNSHPAEPPENLEI